jgi:hypothetical protein
MFRPILEQLEARDCPSTFDFGPTIVAIGGGPNLRISPPALSAGNTAVYVAANQVWTAVNPLGSVTNPELLPLPSTVQP